MDGNYNDGCSVGYIAFVGIIWCFHFEMSLLQDLHSVVDYNGFGDAIWVFSKKLIRTTRNLFGFLTLWKVGNGRSRKFALWGHYLKGLLKFSYYEKERREGAGGGVGFKTTERAHRAELQHWERLNLQFNDLLTVLILWVWLSEYPTCLWNRPWDFNPTSPYCATVDPMSIPLFWHWLWLGKVDLTHWHLWSVI